MKRLKAVPHVKVPTGLTTVKFFPRALVSNSMSVKRNTCATICICGSGEEGSREYIISSGF